MKFKDTTVYKCSLTIQAAATYDFTKSYLLRIGDLVDRREATVAAAELEGTGLQITEREGRSRCDLGS